jgi:hypothetical protein
LSSITPETGKSGEEKGEKVDLRLMAQADNLICGYEAPPE